MKRHKKNDRRWNDRGYRRLGIEPLEVRCLLASDFGDAPDAAIGTSAGDYSTFESPPNDASSGEDVKQSPPVDKHGHEHVLTSFIPETIHAIDPDGFLSQPTDGAPIDIAVAYLATNAHLIGLTADDVDNYVVTDSYQSAHTGVTHIYLQQIYSGLPIASANININITADGRVLNVGSSFLSGLDTAATLAQSVNPMISATTALVELAGEFGWTLATTPQPVSWYAASSVSVGGYANPAQSTLLSASGVSKEDVPAELQFVPTVDGGIELAWRLNVQTMDGQHWYDANVSALDGDVLLLTDWVSAASYNVFALPNESPSDSGRTLEVDPQNATASPFGWHDTNGAAGAEFTRTKGNNVHAYADRNNNNAPDAGSSPNGGGGLVFDFPVNLGMEPITYRDAAVTNLFYWNNTIHDILYQYGFDEVAGNFQESNYGNGGAGSDNVFAEAQDGADVGNRNNANFATPPDGNNPRMQMYLWDLSTPERDGDFDNGIIAHEYGHGVSNRLTGGPANSNALNALQSGGMGEGWSDWFALMFTQIAGDAANDSRGIGTYALNQPTSGAGIRTLPYSYNFAVNDHTFGDIVGSSSVHFIGETWASTLWDLNWALIGGNSLDANLPNAGLGFDPDLYNGTGGNNLALQLVLDGMKLQPANPTFLDARDAILVADQVLTGGVNQGTIWTVFARRGMGLSADDGGNANSTNVTEAFDLPATANGTIELDATFYELGATVTVSLRDSDLSGNQIVAISSDGGDSENVTLTDQGAGFFQGMINTAAGAPAGDGTLQVAANDIITVTYIDADDGSGGINVIKTDTANVIQLFDILVVDFSDAGGNPNNEGFTNSGPANQWHLSTGRGNDPGHSADDSFYFGTGEAAAGGGAYSNNADGTLTSPVIDLTAAQAPIFLEFNHFLQIEDFYDNATVSIFNGAATTLIAGNNTIGLPDNTSGFEAVSLDISSFAGQQIQVLFHFDTDFSVIYEGWYVDDLVVRGVLSTTLLDFGDAPAPYPTTFSNNGARHAIANGLFLGTAPPDVEANGAPDVNAAGDDANDADDEDGVDTPIELITTATTFSIDVIVNNTTGGVANLVGWIDFDGNGLFDLDEAATALVPDSAALATLTWNDLGTTGLNLAAGVTFARFRLTTDAIDGADPIGLASDGEVEDFLVAINEPPPCEAGGPLGILGGPLVLGQNTLNVCNTTPGNRVAVVRGTTPGNAPIVVRGVTFQTDFADPRLHATRVAGANGLAPFTVQTNTDGTYQFQVFELGTNREGSVSVFEVNVAPANPNIPDAVIATSETHLAMLPTTDGDGDATTVQATLLEPDAITQAAYDLDQLYRFFVTPDFPANDYYFNYYGLGEKYIYGSLGTFLIYPNGDLYLWGWPTPIASLSPDYHSFPSLLTEAIDPSLLADAADVTVDVTVDGSNHQITVTPQNSFTGWAIVKVAVTDGIYTVNDLYRVEVTPAAAPPLAEGGEREPLNRDLLEVPTETPTADLIDTPTTALTETPTKTLVEAPAQTATETPTEALAEGATEIRTETRAVRRTSQSTRRVPKLNRNTLGQTIIAAREIYESAGLTTSQLEQLSQVEFAIADLDGSRLGETLGNQIVIEVNAAGYGWYIDPTPLNNQEFLLTGDTLLAAGDSAASGRMDLLTVVLHELGHVLGYDDHDSELGSDDLMYAELAAGLRKLP